MPDISALLANAAQTNANFDLGQLNKSYFEGQNQQASQDLRNAFKGGVPLDASGQPDFNTMARTLFQKGALDQGLAATKMGIAQQQMKFGQAQSSDIARVEGGGAPSSAPLVIPPSVNRSATATVAPPISGNSGPTAKPSATSGGTTIMQVLDAQGIPNDQLGAASASVARQIGVSPTDQIDINDPQVRNVLVPAIAQLKRMGIGQVIPQGQAVPAPQAVPRGQPSPVTNQVTSAAAPAVPSRAEQLIAYYGAMLADPRTPKQNAELAKTRLEALQKSNELTQDQKNYAQAKLEGFQGTLQDFLADNEAKKTAATEDAKLSATKYQSLVDAGVKAQQEIPQLELLQQQMNDPNFFSGSGERYNLAYKRLKSAFGIDPDAAVPQEFLRKATAANVLGSLGALKGLGQIRVAEINMAREAAAAPDNSVPANKLLVEISKRTHERNSEIADMAQNYKEQNGALDAGFDKKVTAYYKAHPLFTDDEIKDWHKVIGETKSASSTSGKDQTFSSPADVHAAVAAGRLKKGDTFTDPNGVQRIVP